MFTQQGCRVFGTVRNTANALAIPGFVFVETNTYRDKNSH